MAISRRLLNDGGTVVVDTRTHMTALLWPRARLEETQRAVDRLLQGVAGATSHEGV